MADKLMIQKVHEVLRDNAALLELAECTDTSHITEVFRKKRLKLTQQTALEVWQSLKDAGVCSRSYGPPDRGNERGGLACTYWL